MSESVESYSVSTVGRTFGLTRQAIVNDDLSAFEMISAFGKAAAEYENQKLVDLLTSNPVLQDGFATFATEHGNLAGTPAAISIASLGVGMKSMRLQKGLDGTTPIDVTPKYLIVPAAQEVLALQFTRTLNATEATNIQPFQLAVLVDPRLDAVSSTAWYLASDSVPGIEYSHLDGSDGPMIDTRAGFDVDGIEWRVRLDFGCGILDHRGLFKNAGA
jgi:hypothetical protein